MATLSTSYVDAVWSGTRKYSVTENQDSTISLTDETNYLVSGSNFGASDINATNEQVNGISGAATVTLAVADWNITGTTINSKTYYTCIKTFTDIFTENPIIAIGAAGTLPTDDEMATFAAIEAAIADTTQNTITFYALVIPSLPVNVIVKGAI